MRLDDRKVRGLKSEDESGTFYWDDVIKGLGLRVFPSGRKRWLVRYRLSGRRRAYPLGDFPTVGVKAARSKATSILGKVADGDDPQAERLGQLRAATVRELFEDYIERDASKKKAPIEQILKRDMPDHWWGRKANEITPPEAMAAVEAVADRGAPGGANTFRAYLNKMFRHGIPRGFVVWNPVRDVPRQAPSKVREADPLSDELLRKLWGALTREDPVIAAFYRLRMLTTQRGEQVRWMRWQDLEGEWWTAPGATTKNGLPQRTWLHPLAQRELERLRAVNGESEFVLASPRKPGQPIGGCQAASRRLRRRVGLPNDWARDFRLTGTTWLTEHGVSKDDCDRVLGHVEPGVIRHYDRYAYDVEKRAALTKWGDHVLEILLRRKPEPAAVVDIATRR